MEATFTNKFHNTKTKMIPVALGICGIEGLEEKYAEFTEAQIKKISRTLCSGNGCVCSKFGTHCAGEDGFEYLVMLAA